MDQNESNIRTFIIIIVAILALSFAHERDVRLLDARIANIEAAR